jgi:cysteine desulfurase
LEILISIYIILVIKIMIVYLDNAATTKVDSQVVAAMLPYFTKKYGNASEYHSLGMEANETIESSRGQIAKFLGAKAEEIIFTSSATESINLAHKGLVEGLVGYHFAEASRGKGRKLHVITTPIEHKAVLETLSHLEKIGWAEVSFLPVDKYGLVKLDQLVQLIKKNTVLVSIMYVNNEVGTVQPIGKIRCILNKFDHKVYLHTDATQAIQYLNCDVDKIGVDLLSFTGHKTYAPKGVGALYARSGTPLVRQMDGGGQERGLRSSTENVPYIVGLGKAIEIASSEKLKAKSEKVERLRDRLIHGILKIPKVTLTGHSEKRAPHIASFIVDGVEGEALVLKLSDLGIMVSSGSACTASDLTASHVLTAMGYKAEESHGSVRFSLGKETTEAEIDYVLAKLPKVVADLRRMAPVF